MKNTFLTGEITSLDLTHGIGVISTNIEGNKRAGVRDKEGKNELFFHLDDLSTDTTVADLKVGIQVSLETVIGEKGPHASQVSKVVHYKANDLREEREVAVPYEGIVKKINEKGFGFLMVKGLAKNVMFEEKNLVGVTLEELREGDNVQFDRIDKSLYAPRAIGVRIIK